MVMRTLVVSLLLLLALCLASILALPVGNHLEDLSVVLGSKNFTETVKSGIWFVNHQSPRCKHCKKLAPIWAQLTQDFHSLSTTKNLHFAKINCRVETELCDRHDIRGYPTILLYNNGNRLSEYEDDDLYDPLATFINKTVHQLAEESSKPDKPAEETSHTKKEKQEDESAQKEKVPEKTSDWKKKEEDRVDTDAVNINPEGNTVSLSSANFDAMTSNGPWFLKFYAPWCPHCRHFAPTWEKLGKVMKGQVNIGSIDCTVETGLCTRFEIPGYPTLKLIVDGTVTEYHGGRELDDLKTFAMQAAGDPVKVIASEQQLDSVKNEIDAFFLLISEDSKSETSKTFTSVARSLFATSHYYRTEDKRISELLNIQHIPALAVLKDDRHIIFTGSLTDKTAVRNFIQEHRYPALITIDANNIKDVLETDRRVMLGLLNPERTDFTKAKQELKKAALDYNQGVLHGSIKEDSKSPIIFAWMDSTDYSSYASRAFGITDSQLPAVVLLDPKEEIYFDVDTEGARFRLERDELLSAIRAVNRGILHSKSTLGAVVGAIKGGVKGIGRVGAAAASSPFMVILCVLVMVSMLVFIMRRSGTSGYAAVDPKSD